jgi:hypothetical protein
VSFGSVLRFIYNYAECRYAECQYAECRGAVLEYVLSMILLLYEYYNLDPMSIFIS